MNSLLSAKIHNCIAHFFLLTFTTKGNCQSINQIATIKSTSEIVKDSLISRARVLTKQIIDIFLSTEIR